MYDIALTAPPGRGEFYVLFRFEHLDIQSRRALTQVVSQTSHPLLQLNVTPNGLVVHSEDTPKTRPALAQALGGLRDMLRGLPDQAGASSGGLLTPQSTIAIEDEMYAGVGRACPSVRSLADAPALVFGHSQDVVDFVAQAVGFPSATDRDHLPDASAVTGRDVSRTILPGSGAGTSDAFWSRAFPRAESAAEVLARSVASWVVGGHPESRLPRALRGAAGFAYNPGALLQWVGGVQWFVFTASTSGSTADDLVRAAERAMSTSRDQGVTLRDSKRAMRFMSAQTREAFASSSGELLMRVAQFDGSDPFGLGVQLLRGEIGEPPLELVAHAHDYITDVSNLHRFVVTPSGGAGRG